MNKRLLARLALAATALSAAMAQAVPPVPEKSGWSGHVNIGAGVGSYESNMIAGISSIDLGQEKISNLRDSPGSEDFVLPAVHFELAYTLGENRTQFYLGNQVADALSVDLETTLQTHLGVRQEVPGITLVDISLAASSLPIDVWKDPYMVDSNRGDTERTVSGLHITFDSLFDTPLEVSWSATEVEIDDERSGAALGLSRADQRLLRRKGMIYNLDLNYEWKINERHRLVPMIGWVDFDLDGDAMAQDGPALVLKHMYQLNRWLVVSQVFYQDLESDTRNPIYADERDMEIIGGTVTVFYAKPFGLEHWDATATLGYQEDDSNIDFYDTSFGLFSVGMFYRFD